MSQNSEELSLEDYVVPLRVGSRRRKGLLVIAHTVPSSRGKSSLLSSTGQIAECLLASAEPPTAASWFYSTSGDFLRGLCWEEAVV